MRYYLSVYTLQPANSLQRMLVEEAKRWNGTLIDSDRAKDDLILLFRTYIEKANKQCAKCRACRLDTGEDVFVIDVRDVVHSTFVTFRFHKIRRYYYGNEV